MLRRRPWTPWRFGDWFCAAFFCRISRRYFEAHLREVSFRPADPVLRSVIFDREDQQTYV